MDTKITESSLSLPAFKTTNIHDLSPVKSLSLGSIPIDADKILIKKEGTSPAGAEKIPQAEEEEAEEEAEKATSTLNQENVTHIYLQFDCSGNNPSVNLTFFYDLKDDDDVGDGNKQNLNTLIFNLATLNKSDNIKLDDIDKGFVAYKNNGADDVANFNAGDNHDFVVYVVKNTDEKTYTLFAFYKNCNMFNDININYIEGSEGSKLKFNKILQSFETLKGIYGNTSDIKNILVNLIDKIFKILNDENNKNISEIITKLESLITSKALDGGKYMKSLQKSSSRARKPSPRGTKTVRKTKPKSKTPKEK